MQRFACRANQRVCKSPCQSQSLLDSLRRTCPSCSEVSIGWSAAGIRPKHTAIASSTLQRLHSLLLGSWPDVLSNAVDPGWVPTKMG